MAGPSFDPNGAVRFDLRNGTASDARGSRLVLVPSAALASLDDASLARIGAEIGKACGARVGARLGGGNGVRNATMEVVVSHLAGEVALTGAFAFHIERWGRAMVAVVNNASLPNDAFVAALLGGAISAAAGRDAVAAPLGHEGSTARFLIGSQETADRVKALVAEGRRYADIVANLQGSAS